MNTDREPNADEAFRRAYQLHQASRLDEADILYVRTLQLQPNHFQASYLLGILAFQRNQMSEASKWFERALTIDPLSSPALLNLGTARLRLGRFGEALEAYDRAIGLKADFVEAHYNRGNALREMGRADDAIRSYDVAISLRPDYAECHINRGLALADVRRYTAAVESFDTALALHPGNADAHFNRGNALRAAGRFDAAIASYDRATTLQPGFADAHLNRGSALVAVHRYAEALRNFDKAIALQPNRAEGYLNRAAALQHLGDYDRAVASYDTAIAIQPAYADAHANRSRALRELKRYEAAISGYTTAISLSGDSSALRADRRHIQMQLCDWHGLDADIARFEADVISGSAALHPFYLLALSGSAALQRRAAENWIRDTCPPIEAVPFNLKRAAPDRLHIAYFSADFHEHATAYLIAELLELHDRSRFRVSAFSFGPDTSDPMRRRLRAAVCDFVDVRHRSDPEVVTLSRAANVDIAIDLKGFTVHNRLGIFARRAAPLQVNYLGFPGTMGSPYIDYLIADHTLVPPGSEQHYTEKICYLPHSYQPNDGKRAIADKMFDRADLGLPSGGFVFCCFNNTFKILPATFDRWMRVLLRVEGSVLWLLGDNPIAMQNLRREAAARGVAPERLIFAPRLDLAHHLARHRCADLFLDTLPCNAHTTASDALWAGLPVLTCPGEPLAARVAASLLAAAGLPELIAPTLDGYEELAVHLATHPEDLATLRRRLADTRLTTPLFDSRRYCRDFEDATYAMFLRHHELG